jgi:hypothetical protein
VFHPTLRRSAVKALCFVAAGLALGGCVDEAADLARADAHTQIVARPDMSIAAASVAFVSVDGPPAAVAASFDQEMVRQAMASNIVVADNRKARYLVRGYLSAYRTEGGAAVEYVWDVFTRDKKRAQRVNDVLEVKGEGADPWAIAGQAALASVAAKSADDLAAFLTNTPEAVALARPAAGEAAAEKPLSYAPAE